MTVQSPTLKRVLQGRLCSGCGLCAGISDGAIEMTMDDSGFPRPVQHCSIPAATEYAIASACPGSTVTPWTEAKAPNRHAYWGPWFQTLTGHSTDAETRFAGASGGALSALAAHALESGLVERVLHVEADPDRPTGNRMRWSYSRAEVIVGAGSRYAASSPLAFIRHALDEGGSFAFVGRPCDVSALRQYARLDRRVGRHVPLMLSFYCAGLPSARGVDRIIRAMGFDPGDVARFRYRGNGWPGLTVAETKDGRKDTMRYAESWGGHLSRELLFRCKICPDAVGGAADIACGDAWYGGEDGYPKFEEMEGRSLVMTRTEIGEQLLASAIAAGAINVQPLPIGEVELMQPAQANRKRVLSARVAACRLLMKPAPKMRGLEVGRAARSASLWEQMRNFFGTARRLLHINANEGR